MMQKLLPSSLFIVGMMCMTQPVGAAGASGRTIGVTCNGCHGTGGRSKGSVPSLYRRPVNQLEKAMRDFKKDKRPATIMDRIAKGYTDREITEMSKYFAGLK
jgi:sulfide dehydrogenase cytochrome subunit